MKNFISILTVVTAIVSSILAQPLMALELSSNIKLSQTQGPTQGNNEIIVSGQDRLFDSKKIVQVSSGYLYSLALDSDGNIYSWGRNNYGQLGNGSTTDSLVPTKVVSSGALSGKKIVQIASGNYHSLALDSEGNVYTWGLNENGQLGDATNNNSSEPISIDNSGVLTGKKIASIATGYRHSLVVTSDGKVYSWGNNQYGMLGDGSTNSSSTPVEVINTGALNNKKIVHIAAGYLHSLAVDEDGQVYSWGYNNFGALGDNSANDSSVPVSVYSTGELVGKKIIQVSAGNYFSLALDSGGSVYSWGLNTSGQLGSGDTTRSYVPLKINGLLIGKTIAQIEAGDMHSLALSSGGRVYSWGSDSYGQLGNGILNDVLLPTEINVSGKEVTYLSAGYDHSAVISASDSVYSWGRNEYGGLGDNTSVNSQVPVTTMFNNLLNRDIVAITFGGVNALSFRIIDGNTISVVVPPHTAGKVDVVITDSDGNAWTLRSGYEYINIIGAPNTGARK